VQIAEVMKLSAEQIADLLVLLGRELLESVAADIRAASGQEVLVKKP
jgi:hypothetical protein